MGIGKKVVERKSKKVLENVTEDIPIVGDIVDDSISSGPMDRIEDDSPLKGDGKRARKGRSKKSKGLLGR